MVCPLGQPWATTACLLLLWLLCQLGENKHVCSSSGSLSFLAASRLMPQRTVRYSKTGPDAGILVFWIFSFNQPFHSSFSLIKRLFSFSSLPAIRVVSSAYLRLLIFLLAILTPAYESSRLAFHMIYSAQKLKKSGDNIQPWCAPSPILNQSIVPHTVLTVASWLSYKFIRRPETLPVAW